MSNLLSVIYITVKVNITPFSISRRLKTKYNRSASSPTLESRLDSLYLSVPIILPRLSYNPYRIAGTRVRGRRFLYRHRCRSRKR